MRNWYLGLLGVLVVAGCGPSYGGEPVKTPAQLVQEQEQIANQEAKSDNGDDTGVNVGEDTDDQKKKDFKKDAARSALTQAARSAHTCVGVVSQDSPHGTGTVTVTFAHNGHVKKATIDAPFAGTEIGKCALNAMKAVIVPNYQGHLVTMDWKVDLSPKKQASDDSN